MSEKGKAKLRKDVVLNPYGATSHLDNKDMTDEIALHLLHTGKASESDFDTLPEGYQAQDEDKKQTAPKKSEPAVKKLEPVKPTAEELAKSLADFDANAEGAYEKGKELVKHLGLRSESLKKLDIFKALADAKATPVKIDDEKDGDPATKKEETGNV